MSKMLFQHVEGVDDLPAYQAAVRATAESGKCKWATAFEMELIAKRANVTILTIAGQFRAQQQGRYVAINSSPAVADCVIIFQSRKQHYSGVQLGSEVGVGPTINWDSVISIASLPSETRELWPQLADAAQEGATSVFVRASASFHTTGRVSTAPPSLTLIHARPNSVQNPRLGTATLPCFATWLIPRQMCCR
eukprot:COSAG01_NODE_4200_length_5248_cov_4.151097_2_plen_193_part_00